MAKPNVAFHQSTSLVKDGHNPDIPITQCKMGQIAPNFQVLLLDLDFPDIVSNNILYYREKCIMLVL